MGFAGSAAATPACSIYWTGATNANWSNSGNWSNSDGGTTAGRIPANTDFVCMSTAPTRTAITLNTNSTVVGISWPKSGSVSPALTVNSGETLTLGTSTTTAASSIFSLNNQGGTVTPISGETLGLGSLTLNSATLAGPGVVTVSGTTSFSNSSTLGVSGTASKKARLVTQGTTSLMSGDPVYFYGGSTWENAGTVNLADGAEMLNEDSTDANAFTNDSGGTLAYTASTAGSEAYLELSVFNNGSVSLGAHSLLDFGNDNNASQTDTGSFTVGTGSTLYLPGTRAENAGTSFGGVGTVDVEGTDTFAGSSVTVNPGTFELDGELVVPSGQTQTLANLTTATGNSGLMGPGSVTVTGTTHLTGSLYLNYNGASATKTHLLTNGTTTFDQSTLVYFYGGSTWENAGTVNLADGAEMLNEDSTDANAFTNDSGGTLAYTASTAGSEAYLELSVFNNGSVSLGAHSLLDFGNDNNASQTDTGSFTVGTGSTLYLPGTRAENAGTSFGGVGTVDVEGTDTFAGSSVTVNPGTFELDGELVVPSGQTQTLANMTVAGGELEGPGSVTVTGTTHLTGSLYLDIDGTSATKAHLLTNGTTTFEQGVVAFLYRGSTWENAGTVNLADGAEMLNEDSTDANAFTNDSGGTLAYTASTAGSEAYLELSVFNNGSVSLGAHSLLDFGNDNNASQTDTGSFTVGTGSTLYLPGTRAENAGTSFGGVGTVDVEGTDTFAGSSVTVNPGTFELDGELVVPSGQTQTLANMTVAGGDLEGPGSVTVTGTTHLTGSLYLNYNGTSATKAHLLTNGTTTFDQGEPVYYYGASTWENAGTVNLADSAFLSNQDSNTSNAFTNDAAGTVSYSGSTATSEADLDVKVTNNGAITSAKGVLGLQTLTNENASGVLSGTGVYNANGTLGFPVAVVNNGATLSIGSAGVVGTFGNGTTNAFTSLTTNTGTLSLARAETISHGVSNSGTVDIGAVKFQPSTYTQTAGTTTVAASGNLQAGSAGTGAVVINGGVLTGNGTVTGALAGSGTVSPGRSAGPLTVAGSYGPTTSGTLAIGISGPSVVGTDFGQLSLSGSGVATLKGTLAITTQTGYTPPLGTSYTILTAGTVSGTFATVTGATLADRQYQVSYTPTSVVLTVVQPPAITSASSTSFTVGTAGTFSVTTTGSPTPSVSDGGATLPSGVTFVDNGNGTATLSGTPAAGSGGSYPFTITASNGATPNATQSFTLTVVEAPAITGVSPSSGPTKGGTSVTITGTGFSGASGVSFGSGNPATSFTVVSATTITAVSPARGAGAVDVVVTSPSGSSPSVSADQFTYVKPPVITGVSPSSGSTKGGTTVTVTGSGFTGATAVTFGATAATSYTVVSDTQITAVSPAQSAGTVNVSVTSPYGKSGVVAADHFTYVKPPAITGVSPSSGSTKGGTTVTVTGSGFTGATAVTFGATAATSYTVVSDTQITVVSPAHSAGTVNVSVTSPYGKSGVVAADHFTYVSG